MIDSCNMSEITNTLEHIHLGVILTVSVVTFGIGLTVAVMNNMRKDTLRDLAHAREALSRIQKEMGIEPDEEEKPVFVVNRIG